MIELLTVIPIEEIVEKGIPYIQKNFDVGNYQKQFDIFWEYFINQWMNNTDPTLWNIHMILQKSNCNEILRNRTNNALERLFSINNFNNIIFIFIFF